jgi:hypothetical protein
MSIEPPNSKQIKEIPQNTIKIHRIDL